MKKVTLETIQNARETIKDIINITPVLESTKMSEKNRCKCIFKM